MYSLFLHRMVLALDSWDSSNQLQVFISLCYVCLLSHILSFAFVTVPYVFVSVLQSISHVLCVQYRFVEGPSNIWVVYVLIFDDNCRSSLLLAGLAHCQRSKHGFNYDDLSSWNKRITLEVCIFCNLRYSGKHWFVWGYTKVNYWKVLHL